MSYLKIIALSFLLASSCFAATWDGPYVGFTMGYESGNAKLSSAETGKLPPKWPIANSLVGDFAFKGAKGEALIGYGKTIDNYYLGGEASTTVYSSQGKAKDTSRDGCTGTHTVLSLKVLRNESFNASFKGGYKLNEETLVYFKPGISSTKFNLTFSNTNTGDPECNFRGGTTKRFNGLALEFGIETRIFDRFLLRVGGSHTLYRRKYLTGEETRCGRLRFSPQSTQVKAGILIPLFL